MVDLFPLISKGYLFGEIPPCFNTISFAALATHQRALLPPEDLRYSSRSADHDLAKAGLQRRRMGIPNPQNFLYISELVVANWTNLRNFSLPSPYSKTVPTIQPDGRRAFFGQHEIDQIVFFRAETRANAKYVLRTDVSKFYPSIYSHTIPWVIHGKQVAKTNPRDFALIGNDLDRRLRNSRDQQTKGIPIGPDFSLLVAEIILSHVDQEFYKVLPHVKGFRFIDDYELGFASYSEAEEGLAILQQALASVELDINFQKTEIIDLPFPLTEGWRSDILDFTFREPAHLQRNDLIRYFSKASEVANQNPGRPVLKYAIRKLRSLPLDPSNGALLQNLLLQIAKNEVGVITSILELLIDFNEGSIALDMDSIREVLLDSIVSSSRVGLDNEVAWALWALLNWRLEIDESAARAISSSDDSITALLALDAFSRGLIPRGLDQAKWNACATLDDLKEENWMLAYEGNIKGWLPAVGGQDYIGQEPFFNALRKNSVSFYDPNAEFRVVPTEYNEA